MKSPKVQMEGRDGGYLVAADTNKPPIMVLNIGFRTRQSLHKTIQYSSGFFVLLVAFICIITLATRPTTPGSLRGSGGGRGGQWSAAGMEGRQVARLHSEDQLELDDIFISVKTTSKVGLVIILFQVNQSIYYYLDVAQDFHVL